MSAKQKPSPVEVLVFRDLLVSNHGDGCQSVACRFCSPQRIFWDLQEKYGDESLIVVEAESKPNNGYNLINKYLSALPESFQTRPGIFLPQWRANDVHELFMFKAGITEASPQKIQNSLTAEDWNSTTFDALYLNGSSVVIMQVVDASLSASGMTRNVINNAFNRMKREITVTQKLLKVHECEMSKMVYVLFFPAKKIKDVVLETDNLQKKWIQKLFEIPRFRTFYV